MPHNKSSLSLIVKCILTEIVLEEQKAQIKKRFDQGQKSFHEKFYQDHEIKIKKSYQIVCVKNC